MVSILSTSGSLHQSFPHCTIKNTSELSTTFLLRSVDNGSLDYETFLFSDADLILRRWLYTNTDFSLRIGFGALYKNSVMTARISILCNRGFDCLVFPEMDSYDTHQSEDTNSLVFLQKYE
jgi:hypothetical protein